MADFKQAIEWLKEGKKVRRKTWASDCYIYKKHSEIYAFIGYSTKWDFYCFGDFEATDWEIYEDFDLLKSIKESKERRIKDFEKPNTIRLNSSNIDKLKKYQFCEKYKSFKPNSVIGLKIIEDNTLNNYEFIIYEEPKETLSDKIQTHLKTTNCIGIEQTHNVLYIDDVKKAIMDIFVWITTEHAPNLSSSDVADKIKEIFGDKLI